ncbi:hypothetical protein JHK87_055533 [Glycine soja]|nr:hypothetical protein JHK87_055533 [Glycine soja]
MFPLHFHYEDVSCQDPLLKLNHANVMEVHGSCEIRVVPKAPYDFIIKMENWLWRFSRGQKFIQTQRGHGMPNFSVRISAVMSLLDSPVELQENSFQFSMETEFCEFSLELEDYFEIFEHIHETLPPWSGFLQKDEGETQLLVAKYELRRKLYKAFCKDSDRPSDMRDKLRYKLPKLPRNSSFA